MTDQTAAVEESWAATRDASWYERPDVHSDKQVHMAGRTSARGEGVMSRCGRSMLDDGLTWKPEDVPAGLRCRANGCRQAWPDASTGAPSARSGGAS